MHMEIYGTTDIQGNKERNSKLRNKETQHTGAISAGGNPLCESLNLSRPSDGYQTLTDAETRGLGATASSGAQYAPQARTNLGQFTMRQYYRPRAHQIRCPRTFLSGGPPPPGPEQGFLLSAGETAPSGMPGFD